MKGIRVLEPGLLTTVQDLGRWGHQQYGIPVAGAMDHLSLQIANLLVGNARDEACLEITLLGPKLMFEVDTVIAITGADLKPKLNGVAIDGWRGIPVERGSILEFGPIRSGCRGYLAVAGGFDLPVVMGSRSTYLRGKLGGFEGRALKKGDHLPFRRYDLDLNGFFPKWYFTQPQYPKKKEIRVVRGPQAEMFTDEGIKTFFNSEYEVTPASDRMGYRLKGPKIEHRDGSDIISDGIPFGGIQVPSDGMPIVLMADRQTTGGYAKIGTVISVDLPLIAQSKPGDIFRFIEVTVEEAQELYLEMERVLASLEKYQLKF
ncbi:KipI antagonist [Anoxybacter fermentans]|uniref:KipI antagonist n=1 Tax=Anoxybacter fermentans TaxID=1323375 RepID=A0A3S9SV00_9FIRM|nr:biotin-dependent carboxyltransferase family protein [Anoxybacter fermentans]AZR72089.1 KipI antagonist [Anoxybacter fermentans]